MQPKVLMVLKVLKDFLKWRRSAVSVVLHLLRPLIWMFWSKKKLTWLKMCINRSRGMFKGVGALRERESFKHLN